MTTHLVALATKPLLVGEFNPYGTGPDFALYPAPSGCAGWRLCCKILDIAPSDYLARFDRANLCVGRWSIREARLEAARLLTTGTGPVVVLGAKVSAAFGLAFEPYANTTLGDPVRAAVILPHPSGLCRLWWEPGAYERARRALNIARVNL